MNNNNHYLLTNTDALIAAQGSQFFSTDVNMVYLSLAGMGIGSSIIFTIGLSVLGRAVNPERAFGIKLMFEMVLAGLLIVIMTRFIFIRFGFPGDERNGADPTLISLLVDRLVNQDKI